MNYWVVGFLWGSARFSGEYFLAQTIQKDLLEYVREVLQISNIVFESETNQGRETWRLKIPRNHPYVTWMLDNGYVGRKESEERDMPELIPENEIEFLKGYFSVHYSIDQIRINGISRPRLRFYASERILQRLNQRLHEDIETGVKKIQNHKMSNICKLLYYQSSKEIEAICDYLKIIPPSTD